MTRIQMIYGDASFEDRKNDASSALMGKTLIIRTAKVLQKSTPTIVANIE